MSTDSLAGAHLCPACGSALRACPVCLSVFGAAPRPGRPRRYCSDACRWRQGHAAARQRGRRRRKRAPMTADEVAAVLAAATWRPGRG